MGYIYNENNFFTGFGSSACVGKVDENGYVYNESNTWSGFSSSACVGRVDEKGYVYNSPNTWNGFSSSACVGRVDEKGYVYNSPNTWEGFSSSACVGRIDEKGYVYTAVNYYTGFASGSCIGRVELDGHHKEAGAALLLLIAPALKEKAKKAEETATVHDDHRNSSKTDSFGGGGGGFGIPIAPVRKRAKSGMSMILGFIIFTVILWIVITVKDAIEDRRFNREKERISTQWCTNEEILKGSENEVVILTQIMEIIHWDKETPSKEVIEYTVEDDGRYWFEIQNESDKAEGITLKAFNEEKKKIAEGVSLTEGHGIMCKDLKAGDLIYLEVKVDHGVKFDIVAYDQPDIEADGNVIIKSTISHEKQVNRHTYIGHPGHCKFVLETDSDNDFSMTIYDSEGNQVHSNYDFYKYVGEATVYDLYEDVYSIYVAQKEGVGDYSITIHVHPYSDYN